MNKFGTDKSVLYYDDENVYLEVITYGYKYGSDVSMSVEFNLLGKEDGETFGLVFIKKSFLYSAEELENFVNNSLTYVNNVSETKLSPIDNDTLNKYALDMANIYL